jgi:hypothetical protein
LRAFGKLVTNITAGIIGLTGLTFAAVDSTPGPSAANLRHSIDAPDCAGNAQPE